MVCENILCGSRLGMSTSSDGWARSVDFIRQVQARDPSVWQALYREYFPLLYRYAYARLGNREDAEDVASQVFVEALKGVDNFKFMDRPILAWLYGIVRNLSASRRRQQGSKRQLRLDAVSERPAAGDADQILDHIALTESLSKLSSLQRESIILRFQLGLSTRQIAALLGKNERAVYSLQVRGIKALRRHLTAAGAALPRRLPIAPSNAEKQGERQGEGIKIQ